MVPYGNNYSPRHVDITGLLHPYYFLRGGIRFANGDTYVNDGKAKQPANFRGPRIVNVPNCDGRR